MIEKQCPRILIAGTSSGCGKTTITCGILSALSSKIAGLTAFKCGPDYIDPMFHKKALGIASYQLDSFFYDENTLRYLCGKHNQSFSVVEGVMGFFDGRSMTSLAGSTYEIANILEIPTILVINGKGTAHSIVPVIQGFLQYQDKHTIQGVILNQVSKSTFSQLKPFIEETFPNKIHVFGYVPPLPEHLIFQSRHLGLITPSELENIQNNLVELGNILSETLLLDEIIHLGESAPPLSYVPPKVEKIHQAVTIAVARDEAFCFYYEDNLELLRDFGATLVFFSPIHDDYLPQGVDGLYIGGGYPELYLDVLSKNQRMKQSILYFLQEERPCIAECGGFMYLCQDIDQIPMVGFLDSSCYRENKLKNFGYVTLTTKNSHLFGDSVKYIKGHEFHYYNASDTGNDFHVEKPNGKTWETGFTTDTFYGGYPHLPFYSDLTIPEIFIKKCLKKEKI